MQILEDNIVESSEAIIVTLASTDPAAMLNLPTASVTIEDNDIVRCCKVCLSILDCILPPLVQ